MFKRLLFVLLILMLTACNAKKEPVIGVETINDKGGMKSDVKFHYFESKDAAIDYYHDVGATDYALMTHKKKDEKELFDEIDAKEKEEIKIVQIETKNGKRADDLAFEYIYEKLGLTIDCAFNGKECK